MAHDIDDGGGENDKLSLSFLFLFLLLLLLSVFVFFHHQMMGILVDRLRLPSAETVLFFAC